MSKKTIVYGCLQYAIKSFTSSDELKNTGCSAISKIFEISEKSNDRIPRGCFAQISDQSFIMSGRRLEDI